MITVLVGDDSFAINEQLKAIKADFPGDIERIDGAAVELKRLPDLLMGSSLFSDKRLVVIRDLSKNTSVWGSFSDWIDRVSDDIHLVLVEEKIDKRTQSYKELKKKANIQEFNSWSDRDYRDAEAWTASLAQSRGLEIDNSSVRYLVQRTGLDKWRISHSVDMLSVLEQPVDSKVIDETIVASVSENVFAVFEAALQGNVKRIQEMIKTLELQEDAYAVFGIIASQTFQLLAIARSGDDDSPEKDFSIHPYVASKLRQSARKLGSRGVEEVAIIIADADQSLKTTSVEPWLLVERALVSIARKK